LPSFDAHIKQAKDNLSTLQSFNKAMPDCCDWQVTICFYTALHLVNAHLSKSGLHYQSHSDVKNALNPYLPISLTKLPEDEYTSYITLQQLSRRSRYLVSEKDQRKPQDGERACLTHHNHLAKACKHLDKLLQFFANKYAINFDKIELTGTELKLSDKLAYIVPK
jgi:hypothetical protein